VLREVGGDDLIAVETHPHARNLRAPVRLEGDEVGQRRGFQ
jgi:hypothetical protein